MFSVNPSQNHLNLSNHTVMLGGHSESTFVQEGGEHSTENKQTLFYDIISVT